MDNQKPKRRRPRLGFILLFLGVLSWSHLYQEEQRVDSEIANQERQFERCAKETRVELEQFLLGRSDSHSYLAAANSLAKMLSYEYTLIPGSEDRRYFQLRSESRELAAQILGLVRQSHGIPGATLLDGFHSDLNKLLRSLMLEAALQEDFAQAEQLALLRARFVKRVLVGGDGNYSRKDWRLCALLSDLEMLPSFGPELSDELLSIKPVLGPVFSHAHDREMRRQLERLAPPYRWKRNLRWAFHKKERAQVERGLKLGYDLPVKEKRLEYLQLYLADYEKKRPGQATSIALSKRITKLVTEKLN